MKKILSMILALAMMLTMVSILPVQAAEIAPEDYPYVNYSFNEDVSAVARGGGSYTYEWSADEGLAGIAGAAKLKMSTTGDEKAYAGDIHVRIPDPNLLIGKRVKISFWVKVDTAKTKLRQEHLQCIVFGNTANKTSQHYFAPAAKIHGQLNSGNWVYAETVLDNWDGMMSSNEVLLSNATIGPRIGGSAGDGTIHTTLAEDSPSREVVWYMDEFRVETIPEGEEVVTDDNVVFLDDCNRSKTVGGGTRNTGTGHDGKAGYASYSSDGGVYCDFTTPNINIKANTWYKVSMWAKADNDATVGHTTQVNLMRQSRLDKTVDSDKNADHPAPYAGDAYQMIRFPKTLTREWQYMELYFKRNVKTFDNKSFQLWYRAGDDTKARKFSMDDFRVEEVGGAVTNGDFELKKSDIPATKYSSTSMDAKDDYVRYGTFYGWHEVGATASVSTDVPADSIGTRSAKIVTTAAGAELHQGIFVENDTDTEFKFWAKGEGESVGKSIQVKLDRKVTTKDALDVFEVPDVELLGEDLVLTNEWKEYTVRYQPSFTGTGAQAGVIPRLPYMSIVVDGGAAGLTYYLDDITYETYVEPVVELQPPKAANVTVDGSAVAGYDVYPYWDLESVNDGVDYTFVRVVKVMDNGEEATLAIEPLLNVYTIPEIAVGAKLRFDILAGEEAGEENTKIFGSYVSYTLDSNVRPAQTIAPELGEFNAEAGSVTGKLFVENNKQETLDLFMVVALYDENDCAIRYEVKNLSAATGEVKDITISVSTAEAEGFAPVAYAKAFVWGGTGVFDTDMTPYADVLVVEK